MKCLDSLRPDGLEWKLVLVANGEKQSDGVLALARSLTPHFSLLEVHETTTPGKARNLGLKDTEGEWVFFIDDDAFVMPGYWKLVEPLLAEPKIEVLGGPDSPAPGMGALASSLALALASPFCTGTTFARHQSVGKKLMLADEERLTSCNLWVRRTLLKEDPFPEDYRRTEENRFLQVLKKNGHGLFYHPLLKVAHHRRNKVRQLWRPSFLAGYYRSKLMKERLTPGSEAFWLPSVFVLLHLLVFFQPEVFWYLVRLYAGIILAVSLGLSARTRKPWLFPLVAFFHYFIVFLFGLGFMAERLGLGRKRRS